MNIKTKIILFTWNFMSILTEASYKGIPSFSLEVIFFVFNFSNNNLDTMFYCQEKICCPCDRQKYLACFQGISKTDFECSIYVAKLHCFFFVGSLFWEWSWIDYIPCPIILCLLYHWFCLFWRLYLIHFLWCRMFFVIIICYFMCRFRGKF